MRTVAIAAVVGLLGACTGEANGDDTGAGTGGDSGTSVTGDSTAPTTSADDGTSAATTGDASGPADSSDDSGSDGADGSTGDTTGEPSGVPMWLGVGPWGYRSHSTDGQTWVTQQNPSTGDDHSPDLLRGVGWGGGWFVAVGGDANSMVMRSADGVNWEEDLFPAGDQWMGGVAYGGGRWVGVGANGWAMISDDDGATWAFIEERLPGPSRRVAFAQDMFVSVGDDGMIATSPDGEAWTDRSQSDSVTLGGIAYGVGDWVAIGQRYNGMGFDTNCFISGDAASWAPCPFTSGRFDGVVSTDGRLIVTVENGYESTEDGQMWTHSDVDIPAVSFLADGLWVGHEGDPRYAGDSLETMEQTDVGERGFRGFTQGWVAGD